MLDVRLYILVRIKLFDFLALEKSMTLSLYDRVLLKHAVCVKLKLSFIIAFLFRGQGRGFPVNHRNDKLKQAKHFLRLICS